MTHQNVVELVEQSVRTEPRCAACASHTIVVARDSGLWLECASPGRRRSLLRPLRTLDIASAHTQRHLLDAEAIAPAA